MNVLYELPDEWEWKKLVDKEVCELIMGQSPKSETYNTDGNGMPFFQGKTEFGDTYPTVIKYCTAPKKIAEIGDILLSVRAPVGPTNIANIQCAIGRGLGAIRPNIDNTLTNYLLYFFRNFEIEIAQKGKGSTFSAITKVELENTDIPLPPLSEQERIVSKLDLLFEKIDKAIALHQNNMIEADVFMGSVLNDMFGELEEKYEKKNIGSMIDLLTDYHSNGAYKTLKANVELLDKEGFALMIRATDLENKDYSHNVKFITEQAYNFMSKSKVYGGEIILPKIGSIGSVYFMPDLNRPVSLAMNIFMIRCSENILNKYLFLYLKSPKGNADILSRANGAVTKTITKDAVRSIELPLPSLKIQEKTVAYIDSMSKKIEKTKQIQKEKMESLVALKASILDQAFRGKL